MLSVDTTTRPHCLQCDKPATMCLCSTVKSVPNRVRVHVLQHRAERRHALGTVRLLKIGLDAIDVHVLPSGSRSAEVQPISLPAGAGVLYPSPDAIDLGDLPRGMALNDLIVIDGTWSHAHRIHRDNPWLAELPHFRLTPTQGSRYRIRTEPRQECLSTVEAVVAALRVLEPELEGTDGILGAFEAMIDAQIAARARPVARRRKPRKARPSRAVPDILRRDPSQVVIVHAEAAPDAPGWQAPYEAARLSAISLDGARRFDRLVSVRTPLDAHLWEHFGVLPRELEPPAPMDDVVAAFMRTFGGDRAPVCVTWGSWTRRCLEQALPDAEHVLLKGVWASVLKGRVPGLDRVVKSLGLNCDAVPCAGRAGVRLAEARALTQHLLADASS